VNRKQRRQAAQGSRKESKVAARAPATAPSSPTVEVGAARPSLTLRIVATIILSPWVRRRVHHSTVRAALAAVAHQVGRTDIAAELERPG
jgi:hypothetical protein